MSKRINYIISELKDQYLIEDNLRPWIIGFSGGKDSTALLQLVWLAISEVPLNERKREIHVVCNDTLVENPVIQSYVLEVLEKIKEASASMNMPIRVDTTIPHPSLRRYILGKCYWKRISCSKQCFSLVYGQNENKTNITFFNRTNC